MGPQLVPYITQELVAPELIKIIIYTYCAGVHSKESFMLSHLILTL
jgi:hypothetical protein